MGPHRRGAGPPAIHPAPGAALRHDGISAFSRYNPPMNFTPTRAAGLAALADFTARAGRDYAETRNADRGPDDRANVSGLSPYLRYRLITEDEVVDAVHARHSPSAAGKFVQEVLWRTYWKGWLELRPAVWRDYLADLADLEAQTGGWRRDYDRALAGNTGIDAFDAWIAELTEYGYLHNHARMWFASIWIFTLRLPWQLGAALFARHLYDGDPASNTLSWRWVAGLQTAGKTYLATAANIAKYTDGRFTAAGLATTARPVAGSPVPPPRMLPFAPPPPKGRAGLLIGEDDLCPETLPLGGAMVAAVASLDGDHGRAPAVEAFVAAALGDARDRAAATFDAPANALPATAGAVGDWARGHGLDTIVTGYVPTGPAANALAPLAAELARDGIMLTQVRREWDTATWPHAQKGYFAFREKCVALSLI